MPAKFPGSRAADGQAAGRRRRARRRGTAAVSGAVPRPQGRPDQRDLGALRRHRRRHRRRRAAGAAAARAGHGRPARRGALSQHAGRAAALARDHRRRSLSRDGARLQRLARRGILRGVARSPDRPRRHPVDQRRRRHRRARALHEARTQGRQPRRVPERQVVSDARGRPLLGGRDRHADAADRARRLRPPRAARIAADVRVPGRRPGGARRSSARASSSSGWLCRSSARRRR